MCCHWKSTPIIGGFHTDGCGSAPDRPRRPGRGSRSCLWCRSAAPRGSAPRPWLTLRAKPTHPIPAVTSCLPPNSCSSSPHGHSENVATEQCFTLCLDVCTFKEADYDNGLCSSAQTVRLHHICQLSVVLDGCKWGKNKAESKVYAENLRCTTAQLLRQNYPHFYTMRQRKSRKSSGIGIETVTSPLTDGP